MITGAWIDHAVLGVTPDFAHELRGLGMTEGAIMTNRMNTRRSDPPWSLRAGRDTYAHAAENLHAAGVSVILTCWPRPAKTQIDALEADMAKLVKACGAVALEVDVEGNWDRKHLAGFPTMKDAAAYLLIALRRAAGGARLELNTYPYHSENGEGADLAPHFDLLIPQAYSVNSRAGKDIAWNDPTLGPGAMQRMTMQRAKQTGAKPAALTACGLAAYEQRFHGHDPKDAMREAIRAAQGMGASRLRWWSSKWIVGKMATPYAGLVIREVSP